MKYEKIDIWNNNKYIGTITYNSYRKHFIFNISGMISQIKFKNSEQLDIILKKYVIIDVDIPLEVKEKIDSIVIMDTIC